MIIETFVNRIGLTGFAAIAAVGVAACSSSSSPGGSGQDAAADVAKANDAATSTPDATAVDDAASTGDATEVDATSIGEDAAAEVDGGDAGAETDAAGGVALTVMNFDAWCTVTINGGTASSLDTISATLAPGSTATIVATPKNSSFQIGPDPWFGVTENDGGAAAGVDNGSGVTETSTATVVVTSTGTSQCVSVCCQFPNNSPVPCPTVNPCP